MLILFHEVQTSTIISGRVQKPGGSGKIAGPRVLFRLIYFKYALIKLHASILGATRQSYNHSHNI